MLLLGAWMDIAERHKMYSSLFAFQSAGGATYNDIPGSDEKYSSEERAFARRELWERS